MSISYIVRGSLLACLASAMIGTTYPECKPANISDDVTLSWTLPQSLKGSGFRLFVVKLNVGTNETKFITTMILNISDVILKTNVTHKIQYTGNISTTGEGVFSIILKNVQEEDAGRYSCVKIRDPLENCGQCLVVLQQPSTPNISISSNSTVPGQPVILKCSSSSQSPPSGHPFTLSYTWRMNREDLQEHGSKLTIQSVTKHDKAAYSCQAIESIEDKQIRSNWSRQLYGPYRVKFDPDSDTVIASEGRNINVTCSADCNPPCTVKWLDNSGQTVPKSLQKAVIKLTERESKKSPYICVVKNSFASISRNVSIQIPSSIRNCASNTVKEDGTISIECTVYGKPQPNVSFKLRGKSVIMKRNNAYKYSHDVKHARCTDHGKYDVTASNNVESPDNYQLHLEVKCAPRMQEHHDSIQLQKNKSHVFWSFNILAYPKPISERLYFLPDDGTGREVENKLQYQQQTADNLFTCTAVYPGDETPDLGKYVIYFQHVEGDRNISLNLVDDEVETGSQPSNAIIPVAVVCSVLVLVLAIVAAVFIQRYKIKKGSERYRVREDVEENSKSCGPSGDDLYATVRKTKRKKNKDLCTKVRKPRNTPQACTNKLYASAGPKSESQALINPDSAGELDGTLNNNCGEKNADGLIYADLDLPAPTIVNGQPVINSKEEPVVYEEIDFSQTPGPQLPEKIWEKEGSAP